MVTLTDAQIAAITNASRPLQPSERVGFMAELLERLIASRDEIGDGMLGRTLRDLQRRYFKPPPDELPPGRPRGSRISADGRLML